MSFLFSFFEALWGLTIEMAPYLLLGFLFAGILHVYFPKDKVNKYLGKRNTASVVNASLLGIPLPLCSCGVIPTGVSFHKNGAGKGATVSFLISTPQTGVDSIMATYALLGLPFALVRPFVALATGIAGGLWANKLPDTTQGAFADTGNGQAGNAHAGLGTLSKVQKMFRYAFLDFLMDISKWLLIGLVIAALVAVILPDDFFTRYIGNDYLSMLLVLAASVPMYVCATGSVPIAAVLLMKGLSPGAAMVFLMAGPATNAATMTVIGNALGKRTLFVYMASIIGGALFFGTLVNELLPASWFQIAQSSHIHHHHEGHFLPHWFSLLSAIALIAMLANGYILRYYPNFYAFAQKKENTSTFSTQLSQRMEPIKIQVNGMTCNHCKASVEKNVGALAGIQEVKVELAEASVVLTGEGIDLDAVRQKVEDIGFEYVGPVAG